MKLSTPPPLPEWDICYPCAEGLGIKVWPGSIFVLAQCDHCHQARYCAKINVDPQGEEQ